MESRHSGIMWGGTRDCEGAVMLCQARTACMVCLLSQSPGFTRFKTALVKKKKLFRLLFRHGLFIAQNCSTQKTADARNFEEIVFCEGLGLRWKVKGLLEA